MESQDELDRYLEHLRLQAPDSRLQNLEVRVWQEVAARAAPCGWTAQLRWQGAAILLATSLGFAFGGAAADKPAKSVNMAVFSADASFAPSTILGNS